VKYYGLVSSDAIRNRGVLIGWIQVCVEYLELTVVGVACWCDIVVSGGRGMG
jgi:hypothetical protein